MATAAGRFQFVPRPVRGVIDGASLALPTGSGQILFYEIIDGANLANSLGYKGFSGMGRKVGFVAYDFINSRWASIFTQNDLLTTNQPTTFQDDIGQVKAFIATLSSPPVPLLDEAGDDVPWPASFPNVNVS